MSNLTSNPRCHTIYDIETAFFQCLKKNAALAKLRPHRTHLFQLALRAGMAPSLVSRTHLGLTLVAMVSAIGMTKTQSPWHQAFLLPPLVVQLLWLGYVDRLRRRARLPWNEPGLRGDIEGKAG